MKNYAIIDESNFPLVTISFTGEKSSDENFSTYLREMKAAYRHQTPFVIIFDATNAVFPAIKHQKMQAGWIKEYDQMIKDYCLGTAYVMPGAMIRTVLKSILSLQKQPVPFLVAKSMEGGYQWAQSLLDQNKTS